MRRSRGFTLIELLVVIAIIAILAAILFPVFARARAKAQQNNCLSNIKQLALGELMYVSDYDGTFPYAWRTENIGSNAMGAIYPYVKNLQIYACPSSNTTPWIGTTGWGPVGPFAYCDYQNNPCLGTIGGYYGCYLPTNWPSPPLRDAAIYNPAEMMMIREMDGPGWFYTTNPDRAYFQGLYVGPTPWEQSSYNPTYAYPNIGKRHNEGLNMAFVDGHAKWVAIAKAYDFSGTSKMWNNIP